MKRLSLRLLIFVLGAIFLILGGIYWYYNTYRFVREANRIFEKSGIKGGLIVHVGCKNGKLTSALYANDSYLVQGLSSEEQKVEKARQFIKDQGLYGEVSVEHWDQQTLPYANNMVNLLVTDEPGRISEDEMLRVLAPNGVALTKESEEWEKTVKSRPEGIDDWTHYLHGADNNAVARDTVVGPPKSVQWISGPPYARSHEVNSSMAAMVTSGDRIFYIWDEGPIGVVDKRLPSQWKLIARDAFNGKLLWKRPMPDWGWRQWHADSIWEEPRERAKMLREQPATLPRRLVAGEEHIYATLGYHAPVSVLNPKTGEKIRDFEQTELTDEILLSGDTLILNVRTDQNPPETHVWDYFGESTPEQSGRVMAIDAKTGETLWQTDPGKMAPLTLSERNGQVYYSNYNQVVCLDMENGRILWKSQPIQCKKGFRATCGTLVPRDEVIVYACRRSSSDHDATRPVALSSETGEVLWEGPFYEGPGISNPADLFVVDGVVWLGNTNLPIKDTETKVQRKGYDLYTGEVVREISVPYLKSAGHHFRCYRSKATSRYLMLPKRGVEFFDLKGDNHMRHNWLRAPCVYGTLPANGLLYMAPHPCVCYPGVLLNNFNALSTRNVDNTYPPAPAERLQHGPAWKQVGRPDKTNLEQNMEDWPAYRRDPQRSGSIPHTVSADLEKQWETTLNGELTPPVVADGRLLVAEKNGHTIHALDAENGSRLWQFTAGGPIDSPPTVYGQLVLFGSTDGHVYCLRASDGKLVWRFMAAPKERRVLVKEQLESTWPVNGSVMVQEDATADPPRLVVYFISGRSSFLDGGIRIYGLDPYTGKVLHQNQLEGPFPDPYEEVPMQAGYMNGAKSNILVSDGADLYFYQERFTGDLTRVTPPMRKRSSEGGGIRIYEEASERNADGRHLMPTGGFLDDTYNEGTCWIYGRRWPGWSRHLLGGSGGYGQLLVFNEEAVFGVHVMTKSIRVRRGFTPGENDRLFAREHGASKDKWSKSIPLKIRSMVLAGEKLFVAGPPDIVPEDNPLAALEGKKGCRLLVLSPEKGKKLADYKLESTPVFDGMIAAEHKLYMTMKNSGIVCLGGSKNRDSK